MNKLVSLALFVCAFIPFSCKIKKDISFNRDSVYIQRLVPIRLPSDTARVKALLECNIQGRIVANQLSIETTRNARFSFLLDSIGNLQVQAITEFDTIYIPSDSIRIIETEVIEKTEYIEKPLSKWQKFVQDFGLGAFFISIGLLIFVIGQIIYRVKKVI